MVGVLGLDWWQVPLYALMAGFGWSAGVTVWSAIVAALSRDL